MIWPFFPNWKSPYSETFAYRTEIITSDSGREQRRAWRVKARRTVNYDTIAHGANLPILRRFLIDRGRTLIFPDEVRRAKVTGEASGYQAVFGTPLPDWMTSGQQVVFEARVSREREIRTISDTSGGMVTFTASSERIWPSGTRVMPALVGTLEPTVKLVAETDSVGRSAIRLIVEPGTESERPGLPAQTFGGREVLTLKPNWMDRPDITSTDPTKWVDFETGVRAAYRSVDFTTEVSRRTYLISRPSHLDAILGLFMRSRGRQGEFYVPSWTQDIPLAESVAGGSSQFSTLSHAFYDAYVNDLTRRCFCIRYPDRSLGFFRVVGMAKSTSGPHRTILTTATPAPRDIPMSSTVSWMPVSRFANDELTITWQTDAVADIVINLQTLEDLP